MIKCFFSHSSHDKASYVREVVSKIKKEARVFDEETFEEGMSPFEEIVKGLDDSSLFVIFISVSALESKWVQTELKNAKGLLDASKLERIYPIIIEPGIDHNDIRIPAWMRESLNIQPIFKTAIAARKINARLTEISWSFHPRLKERQEIFVGRNDLVKEIEERIDDFSQMTPSVLIASGLPSIGRKSLIQYALRKTNLVRDSYEFPIISLNQHDSIEDFILKIYDLGFVISPNIHDRLHGTFDDKLALAKEIVSQVASEGERVIIEDWAVLIQKNAEIVDWFAEIVTSISKFNHLTFGVASQFRPNPSINRTNPLFFTIAVKEMEPPERNGLLVRYSKFQNLDLSRDDYSFFSDLLTGYPEQVLFAVDLLLDKGIIPAKKLSHTIQQYGSDKAKVVLEGFKTDVTVLNFVYLLSKFEFISYEVLFDIVDETTYFPILQKLLGLSICERMGVSADYVRVNEVVRDYISRSQFGLPTSFESSIKKHVSGFLASYEDDNHDISDYIFSAQEALRSGKPIPDDLIIPSVFIKTIKKLYDENKNYIDALALANRVLLKEKYLHKNTIQHIRFIKCQCLARLRNQSFFSEVVHVNEPDRFFLYGFYYRISGGLEKAEENLKRALSHGHGRRDPRVIGELVLVYMQSEEYELAYDLAKENYKNRPGNPINASNYFACLIMKNKSQENREELQRIIDRLSIDPSERAQEMFQSANAKLIAYYDNDEHKSMELIEEAINKFPDVNYTFLTKAELASYFKNKKKMQEAVEVLAKLTKPNAQTYRSFIRFKAMLFAMNGDIYQAKQLVNKELKGLTGKSLQKLNERLEYLATGS
jgi:tetratricopeptide (TPR) repeat protein